MTSVWSASDLGWGGLGDWILGSREETSTKESAWSYNQRI